MMQIFPHMEVDDDRGCVLPIIIIKKPSSLSLSYCLLFSSPKNLLKYFSLSSPLIYWSHVATFCWNLYGQGHSPLFLSFDENPQYSTSAFLLYLIYLYSRLWLKIERFSFLITWWKFTKWFILLDAKTPAKLALRYSNTFLRHIYNTNNDNNNNNNNNNNSNGNNINKSQST